MFEANYQIISGWLLTFEIARDMHVCVTRGQMSLHLTRQQFFEIIALKTVSKKEVSSGEPG